MKQGYKNVMFLALFLCTIISIKAQDRMVSGEVSDTSGGLPGVSIIIKGTTSGTETDFDGKYSVKVKQGDVLVFSFVGMKTIEKTVGLSNIINVQLVEDTNVLEEVVVTGVAGATSRKKLSVTVNSVGEKQLENIPTSSAASALQGKVAGVTVTNFGQPGSGATIQLRGATNLFGTQQPLVIVDGVIVEAGIQDINTDDVKSFEIVKGASASALYGSRAGNGVIVITTKRGKKGKLQVTLKNELGFSQLNNKIELNRSHKYELASDWEDFKGVYTKFEGANYPSDYNGSDYSQVTGGRITKADDYNDNPYGVYYDNQDIFFKTGYDKTLYASIAGASENTKLFFSAENTNNEGVLRETKGYERNSYRLNADFQINDWASFHTSNNYIRTINHTPGGTGGIFFALSTSEPDVDLTAPNLDGQPYNYVPNVWASTVTNPIYPLYKNEEKRVENKFLGAYRLNLSFTDWLNLDAEYALESRNRVFDDYNPYNTHTTGGALTNLYTIYSKGDLYNESRYSLSQKGQFTLNYSKSWDNLTIKAKLSYLMEDFHYEDFYAYGSQFIYQEGSVSLDNFEPKNTLIGSDKINERAQNIFGIIGLDYKDRYIFDAMYRYDGSSLFGENNRWNSYYRASGAYRISKDVEIPGVQELKVHAAYGTAGQRPGFDWQYDQVVLTNGSLGTDRTKANPDLKPSKTTELEVGLNTSFLDRFNLEAVYSKAKTEDQFMLVDIFAPANNGRNKQWQNIGTVEFNTLEIMLGAKVFDKKDFGWDLNFAFEKTNNEITELNVDPITVGPTFGELFRIEEGVEFGTMFGQKFVTSLDQMAQQLPVGKTIGEYVVNENGVVVEKATVGTINEKASRLKDANGNDYFGVIGSQTPDFKLGITSNMRYKGFNFYMLWDWKQGGDIYNKNGQWLTRDDRHQMVDQAGKPAAEKKTNTYYQSLYDANNQNQFWVEDGTYVKLREASLFYTFSEDKLKNVANGFFDSLRIGVTGKNLLTFTDYSGWDPEVQSYDAGTQQYYSFDFQLYPVYTSYSMSVMLKF